ncbi:MAG: hypothetical protein VYD64_00325 [Pseudomonadota bacterium]|nr:hypothetical protein [Pseudomonadota bacterium]
MSIEILVILVVAGVSLVIAAVAWSGLSRPARIDGEDHARALLRAEFPDISLGEGMVTGDGRAAFFRCGNDRVAIAAVFGDRFVLRRFEPGEIREFDVGDDGSARFRFNDFTFPALRVRFASEADARNLAGWLEESHA